MIHAYYIVCKHTADPCLTKAYTHCHCHSVAHGPLSHMERGEGMTTHHYQTADGAVEVQTTLRLPGGGAAFAGAANGNTHSGSDGTGSQAYFPAESRLHSGMASPTNGSAMRAYEAQAPAYEQAHVNGKAYNGDAKPFTTRR